MNLKILFLLSILFPLLISAQVGVGTTLPEGALDVQSSNNGLLIPRIALTAKNVVAPVTNPSGATVANSTLIYNTATAGTSPNNIVPAFYYWDASSLLWIYLGNDPTIPSKSWNVNGNSGTADATNFIGTTDAAPLNFRVENKKAGRISSSGTTFIGFEAGNSNPNTNNSRLNTAVGYRAFYANNLDTARDNVAIGYSALQGNFGSLNTAVGSQALSSTAPATSTNNTAVGSFALEKNTATGNSAFGALALNKNSIGNGNTAVGQKSLQDNVTANNNTAVGWESLRESTNNNNTAIGFSAASAITTGSNNIAIGANTQITTATSSNQMNIGNAIFGDTMSTTLLSKIGIGTSLPTEKLDVAGNLKFSGALMPNSVAGTAGQVLTSSGAGVAPVWGSISTTTFLPYATTGAATGIYNITLTQYTIRILDAVSGIQLPTAVGNIGKIFIIVGARSLTSKSISAPAGGGSVIIDSSPSAITALNAGDRYMVQSDGTNWIVIGT